MGDEIGFVTSRTSTIRTDILFELSGDGWNYVRRHCERSEAIQRKTRKLDCFVAIAARNDETRLSRWILVAKIRFDRAVNLDRQRVAVTILGGACGHAHPALADAILFDVGLLDALEANADIARQYIGVVVRALRIGRQTIRQLVAHGLILLVHSSASISRVSPSGFAVGACRATTLPERSTRNLVKFHLIDGPSNPAFSFFKY